MAGQDESAFENAMRGLALRDDPGAPVAITGYGQLYSLAGVLTHRSSAGTITQLAFADNVCDSATFVVATEASDVIAVTVTLVDADAVALNAARTVFCYLSIASTGVGPIVDAAIPDTQTLVSSISTGTLATGVVLDPAAATTINGKAGWFSCNTSGSMVFDLEDAGTLASMYLTVVSSTGKLSASGAITFAA